MKCGRKRRLKFMFELEGIIKRKSSGKDGGRGSKFHKTFHISFVHHWNSKSVRLEKRHPIVSFFLALRRGYVRWCRAGKVFHHVQNALLRIAYFKRSMSSCVRPKLTSCMVGSDDRCGKALSSFSQHSSNRLGKSSQILNREPVLLFSWMFTTPPWMYMQPALGKAKTVDITVSIFQTQHH